MKALAAATLVVHLAFIFWVIFGALVTRGRPWLKALHLASLIYAVIIEIGPWPCPLTLAEQYFESRAGIEPYRGGFLVHYLDALVYPNVPGWLLSAFAVLILIANVAVDCRLDRLISLHVFCGPRNPQSARHHFSGRGIHRA